MPQYVASASAPRAQFSRPCSSSRCSMASPVFVGLPRRMLQMSIDGHDVQAMEGTTILDACRQLGIDTPTLCTLETLTPVNVCRVCVVEVEGSRVLVPACSRQVQAGMKVLTDSDRVGPSRRALRATPPSR